LSHNKLTRLAFEKGERLEILIPRLFEENGRNFFRTAAALGVYPNALRHWIAQNPSCMAHLLPPHSKLLVQRPRGGANNGEE